MFFLNISRTRQPRRVLSWELQTQATVQDRQQEVEVNHRLICIEPRESTQLDLPSSMFSWLEHYNTLMIVRSFDSESLWREEWTSVYISMEFHSTLFRVFVAISQISGSGISLRLVSTEWRHIPPVWDNVSIKLAKYLSWAVQVPPLSTAKIFEQWVCQRC